MNPWIAAHEAVTQRFEAGIWKALDDAIVSAMQQRKLVTWPELVANGVDEDVKPDVVVEDVR